MARCITTKLLPLVLIALMMPGNAREQNIHALRSAYLYYFSHFITWPETTPFEQGTLNLCSANDNPDDRYQLKTINDKSLEHYVLKIRFIDGDTLSNTENIKECHMLYLSEEYSKTLNTSMAELPSYTLVVTEGESEPKGLVHLFTDNNKLKFEIGHNALTTAGFKVSSKLLRLAKQRGG